MFEELIKSVKSLNLPIGKYVLFGSAPIIVKGLRPALHDIDIVVKEDLWNEYQNKEGWVKKPFNDKETYLEWSGKNIEFWKSWGPGEWDVNKIIEEAEIIDGLPFVQLETVLEWKKICARPKDIEDIKLLEKYILNK